MPSRPTLRKGSKGPDVADLQTLLNRRGYTPRLVADGDFGNKTDTAVRWFQGRNRLTVDGVVGPATWRALEGATSSYGTSPTTSAGTSGGTSQSGSQPPTSQSGSSGGSTTPAAGAITDPNYWPPRPDFGPSTLAQRVRDFGMFAYRSAPTSGNPEAIQITDDWPSRNIISVNIPQLVGKDCYGRAHNGRVQWHRNAASQLQGLFRAWDEAGLIGRILTYGGSYVPRFIRGRAGRGDAYLSNHAWGTAFDINMTWNGLGANPAPVGQRGSVRELVAIANRFGFYWGGFFSRKDGMHFEVARIV